MYKQTYDATYMIWKKRKKKEEEKPRYQLSKKLFNRIFWKLLLISPEFIIQDLTKQKTWLRL